MTLVWNWPVTWDPIAPVVRDMLQTHIRAAMKDNTNPLIRGNIEIEDLNFGTGPPVVALRRIHELSETRTKVDVYVCYAGDGGVNLRGLDINLDGCAVTTPFFCPFEMTLCDLKIEDTITVDIVTPAAAAASQAASPVTIPPPLSTLVPKAVGAGSRSLWGGRGAGVMRPTTPGVALAMASRMGGDAAAPLPVAPPVPVLSAPPPPRAPPQPKRLVTLRFWDNPVKQFHVRSNFSNMQGADKKVESALRSILNPALESMKLQGTKFEI